MGLYIFKNPITKEVVEIFQKMNDAHVFEKEGIKYERVFTIPEASIDTKIDPFSAKDFREKTSKKRETLGSLWDRSRDASEIRNKKVGKDPVKQKFYDNWSKRRKGKKHPNATAEGY